LYAGALGTIHAEPVGIYFAEQLPIPAF
jgi:hypothetical protein